MVRPKKQLGQHFLTDTGVARKIVSSLSCEPGDNVLEIGPGKGVLTKLLLEKDIRLKVIELDVESVDFLKDNFPQLSIIQGDFLKTDLGKIFDNEEFRIIGNFPYNISSQIVFSVLENDHLIKEMTGMFQKEVAKRICSEPGNKDYGILSVLSQVNFDCRYHFTVNEGVFFPPPKVKSGVISLKRKEDLLDKEDFAKLGTLVKLAFNQRRKQLRNSLRSMLPDGFDHPELSKRPEQLHYTEFLELLEDIQSA